MIRGFWMDTKVKTVKLADQGDDVGAETGARHQNKANEMDGTQN